MKHMQVVSSSQQFWSSHWMLINVSLGKYSMGYPWPFQNLASEPKVLDRFNNHVSTMTFIHCIAWIRKLQTHLPYIKSQVESLLMTGSFSESSPILALGQSATIWVDQYVGNDAWITIHDDNDDDNDDCQNQLQCTCKRLHSCW